VQQFLGISSNANKPIVKRRWEGDNLAHAQQDKSQQTPSRLNHVYMSRIKGIAEGAPSSRGKIMEKIKIYVFLSIKREIM